MKTATAPLPPLRSVKVLDQLRERIRYLHYSLQTEQAYVHWVRAFIRFHGVRHPATIYDQSQAIAQGKQTLASLPEGLEVMKDGSTTYLVQDVKIKRKPEVYQIKEGNWVIKVGK